MMDSIWPRRLGGRRMMIAVAALSVSASTNASAQRTTDVEALVARAASTYKAARTATARFEQTLTNPLTGSKSVSRGVLQRQKPDRFNFEFTDPKGDRVVADGRALWVYTPSTAPKQVIKMPLAAAGGAMVDPGLQFFESPGSRFTIGDAGTARIDGAMTRVLTLTPKTSGAPFTRATVWLDPSDGTLRQFETVDGMGVVRRVLLQDLRVNVPVAARSFVFSPPAGVRVIDQAALMGGRP